MTVLAIALLALLIFMSGLFCVSIALTNNGVADIGYGIAFIVLIAAAVAQVTSLTTLQWLIVVLPVVWGLRLAIRIGRKNLGKPEDFRYAQWRKDWGNTVHIRSFLQIYMLQGAIVFLIASPVLLTLVFPAARSLDPLTIVGIAVWVVGFGFEVVGDAQLDRFVADKANRGKIMMSGLWKYSRHPNYFGESLMWWGIGLACAPLTTWPAACLVSPLLITFLLLKVSGVPMLEKRWEGNPSWEAYKARTSVLVPLPPRP